MKKFSQKNYRLLDQIKLEKIHPHSLKPIFYPLKNASPLTFYPDFFNLETSNILWHYFKSLPFESPLIKVFGKTCRQPRLSSWYSDNSINFRYSRQSLKIRPIDQVMQKIISLIDSKLKLHFNSILINYYRDGHDKVDPHRDNEKIFGHDPVIASLSFGTTRRFRLRHYLDYRNKTIKNHSTLELSLHHGSLLIMGQGTQIHWEHSIPREKKISQERINLTLRKTV